MKAVIETDAAQVESTGAGIDSLANELSHQSRNWQQLETSTRK